MQTRFELTYERFKKIYNFLSPPCSPLRDGVEYKSFRWYWDAWTYTSKKGKKIILTKESLQRGYGGDRKYERRYYAEFMKGEENGQ